jgi:hypothetical protein
MENISNKIQQILQYKEFIDNNPTNDFFIFPFISMVLNLTDPIGFITDDGIKMLHIPIEDDFKIINECPHNPSQKALTRIALYFALIHNLITFFSGFIYIMDTEEGAKYADKLPVELLEYLKVINKRVEIYSELTKIQLDNILPKLTNKYAKVFNEAKRLHWNKDIYQNEITHIPAHPDDLPDGFSPEKCVNLGK